MEKPLQVFLLLLINLFVGPKLRLINQHRIGSSFLLFPLLLAIPIQINAQSTEGNEISRPSAPRETSCPNSNFSQGDFTNWRGFYGSFADPAAYEGFVTATENPRHLIIRAPGSKDFNTCSELMTVPPGEAYAARLGNDSIGAQGEQLRYTITVSEESNLFIYKYAVVFQDPDHAPADQPSFTIEITNAAGQVFDSACGYYYVYSHSGIPGWNKCDRFGTPVLWKDWTTVGLDLSPYLGQTINIVFTTRDCQQSKHFGYAYLSTSCSKLEMTVDFCTNNGAISLSAPPGFSYLWGDGQTTQTITMLNPENGKSVSCVLTSVNGCKVTIRSLINPTTIIADFSVVPDEPKVEIPFYDLSRINQNQIVDWDWNFGDGTPVVHEPNPKHTFARRGIYNVRLIVSSTEGCRDTITKPIKVDSPSRMFFPSAFSPNGDGMNDIFLPKAANIGRYHLSIFNREGQLLFDTNDPELGWDGTVNGKACPSEVYVYTVTYEMLEVEETYTKTGTVSLTR